MSKVTMRRPDARAMAQLLAEQTQTAAGLILRLAWRQGLTREEIQRLTWNDVDFSAHQLRLLDRTIPLETETEDCLRRQAERPDPPTPFVVVSDRRRQQMPPESISRLARKTLDRAGLGGISLMDRSIDFKQIKSSGDAFLIATAMKYGLTVITEENKKGEKKIPYVCKNLNVPCIDILGLCEKEGWQF